MILKLATNGQSDFCSRQKFIPKWLSALPYMFKIIKNVYKIRLQRDLFEACNKWAKW